MREIVFKMERPGLVEVGQELDVSESVTPVNVNYMIEPAEQKGHREGYHPE